MELNIARWPAMWQPSKSKTKAAVRTFSREMTFADGSRGTAQLEVGYTQFGTITTEDHRMLSVLVKQWEDLGKPAEQIFFSDRLLARLLKKSWGTNVIEAVTGSLRRLRLTPLRWIKSYHRSEMPGKSVEEEVPFTLLSDLKIIKRKTDGHVTNQQGYFQFDRNVLENLLANYAKPLLLEEFLKIKSEIGQLIYSHIDLIMADKPRYERCSKDLFRDLGLIEVPAYRHASHRKQALQRALKELDGILISTGQIKSATLERTKDGKDYKVVFQKGAYAVATEDHEALSEALPTETAQRPVVNDYRKIKDPLVVQAEAIVRFFYKTVHQVDHHFPQAKEVAQAVALITQYGADKSGHIIEYAAERAKDTNFAMQHFGAVLSYASRAIAELDRRRPEQTAVDRQDRPRREEKKSWKRGEARLAVLIEEQYLVRFETAKADLFRESSFFARNWKDGNKIYEKTVHARVIRDLETEPMELVLLPPWLTALCQRHHMAQNLPI